MYPNRQKNAGLTLKALTLYHTGAKIIYTDWKYPISELLLQWRTPIKLTFVISGNYVKGQNKTMMSGLFRHQQGVRDERWDLIYLHWFVLHVEVPDFSSEVVSGEQVASTVTELYIRHRGGDLREEGSMGWVHWLLKYWDTHRQKQIYYLQIYCITEKKD